MKVGVVGGSMAGVASGCALSRLGHEVTILERSPNPLIERGGGIGMFTPLLAELRRRHLADDRLVGVHTSRRLWSTKDGDLRYGRILGEETLHNMENHHWGLVYDQLVSRLDGDVFERGQRLIGVTADADRVVAQLADGSEREFEMLIGADGVDSTVAAFVPGSQPKHYCGYPAWRGIMPETAADGVVPVTDRLNVVGTTRGTALFYLVPGTDGSTEPGGRRLNWLWYDASVPTSIYDESADTGSAAGLSETQLAHLMHAAADQLPSWHAGVVRGTPRPYMQPIYERNAASYVGRRVGLVGDAACAARPHTGAGTLKALQDALALSDSLEANSSVADALAQYDRARCKDGNDWVDTGRQMGGEQVTSCPDWSSLDTSSFEAWIKGLAHSYYIKADD